MALPKQAHSVYRLIASFNALPARNLGTLAALILIAAPVWGLRPVRAARLPTAKVPNPTRVTDPPFLSVVLIPPITASSARPAAAFDTSACFAMCSIISDLFTSTPLSNCLLIIRFLFLDSEFLAYVDRAGELN